MTLRNPKTSARPGLLKRLGLKPDDTEFNRRAQHYAYNAKQLASVRKSQAKKKAERAR